MKPNSAPSSPPPHRSASSASVPVPPPASHHDWLHDWWWLILPATIASHIWWYFLHRVLIGHSGVNSNGWVGAILLVLIMVAGIGGMVGINSLNGYLVRSNWWRAIIALWLVAQGLWYLPLTWWTVVAMITSAAGLWSGSRAIHQESDERVHVQPWSVLPVGAGPAMLGITLGVAIALAQAVVATSLPPQQRVDRLITQSVKLVEDYAQPLYPKLKASMTVDQAIGLNFPSADSLLNSVGITDRLTTDQQRRLQQQLTDQGIDTSVATGQTRQQLEQSLSQAIQQYENQALSSARDELGQRFKIQLRGDETIHQALVEALREQINGPALRYAQFFAPLIAVIIWLLLRLLTPLLLWAALLAGWLWYRALHLTRAIRISRRVEEVEQLEWGPPHVH